jgi:hypothetical protein
MTNRRLLFLVASLLVLTVAATSAAPVRVQFRFQHATAATVNLAGTFNNWCNASSGEIDTGIDPMNGPDIGGWWTLDKLLEPGYYEYKLVANGNTWFTDPLNPRSNPDNYGNSVLQVSNPLVYYVLPRKSSIVGDPTPEVNATLAKTDASSFNLTTLRITIDGSVAASGAQYYDAGTRRVSYAPPSALPDGTHTAKVRVSIVGGGSHADSTEFVIEADTAPPVIAHAPAAGFVARAAVVVSCTITDDRGVREASLHYRNEGDASFVETPLFGGLDDVWTGTVPAGFTQAGRDVEYYLEASDRANTTRSPETGVWSVPVSADNVAPVISEAFSSPSTFSPDGVDDASRLSFHLSEPATVTVLVRTSSGTLRRTLMSGQSLGAGYHSVVWDGRNDSGSKVPNGQYRFHVNAVDGGGLPATEIVVPVVVDRGSQPWPINVVLLFHANQNLNYQGDTANDVCFWGLVDVLRRHPQSKFMLHFSGSLLHDLGWFNFRHSPSTLDLLRAGFEDGQFEIVGSTYAQNVPYATDMWDNEQQVEVHREVIGEMLGASPVSFWNAERCWKQALVPLLAQNGYGATWVETHILNDSGTSVPEHAVRRTAVGDDELTVFNDDGELTGLLDWSIDSGNTSDILNYLSGLRSQDTYRDWVVCYCEDAEATGLWDYEGGGDPQSNWDHLDDVLTAMESTGWIKLTTFSEYLSSRFPTEDLSPIVDGQANWMVGPSQSAGYADWFDFQERAPYVNQYRGFFETLRERIQSVQPLAAPGTPAADLVKHAIWNLVAHQFEFGCIGCGWWGNQDYHKAETLEGALLAAEAALSPPGRTEIVERDANGDGVLDWTIATPRDFYIVSRTGGRLLRWFDLVRGEEVLGNELFMWGYYYTGWRDWYTGSGENDDYHYTSDFTWNATNFAPSAAPYTRTYKIRKHAMNDRLSTDGGTDTALLDAVYQASSSGDTLRLTHTRTGLTITKSYVAGDTTLSIKYRFTNTSGQTHAYTLTIENELNPSLLDVMNGGRGTLVYWDGSSTSATITPSSIGVVNVRTERAVVFTFSQTPTALAGGETVHGLLMNPRFQFGLAPGAQKILTVTLGVGPASVEPGDGDLHGLLLRQNHPNPFNPATAIAFELPASGPTELAVFNVAGERVATLVDGPMDEGPHLESWAGTDDAGSALASGVYFFMLAQGGRKTVKKGVLLR